MNKVIASGNLTRDPELNHTSEGTACCDLGLAINQSYKNKAGEIIEKTVFIDVVVWGKQAEAQAEHKKKGDPVLIEGRLQLDQWETEGNEKRSKLRVRADKIEWLHRSSQNSRPAPNEADAPAEYEDDIPF